MAWGQVSRSASRRIKTEKKGIGMQEAELILMAVEGAQANAAWDLLRLDEKAGICAAKEQLAKVEVCGDPAVIRDAILELDKATHRLAEFMMDAAVARAIRGGQ